MKRMLSLILVLALSACLFAGCSEAVGQIAGNVADAAKEELEKQIKEKFEEYKVDVVELRTAFGKLNDETDSSTQIFCAALVKSNSDALPQSCADALDYLFTETGVESQTMSAIENSHLVHKSLKFNHSDFSAGGYYIVWFYHSSLTGDFLSTEGA